jgi:predicted amidohydrolase
MTVLLSNCVGHCADFECGGGSAVWNREGVMLVQLDSVEEGILVLDTGTGEVTRKELNSIAYEGQ